MDKDVLDAIFNSYLYRLPTPGEYEYYGRLAHTECELILSNSEEHKQILLIERVLGQHKIEVNN